MQPFFVTANNHKSVVTAPSHAIRCGAKFKYLHPPRYSLDISNCMSPRMWFIHFHVVELLVRPTQDILVSQPISHPVVSLGTRTSSTPCGSGRVEIGHTRQGLLSLHLLLWHRRGGGTWQTTFAALSRGYEKERTEQPTEQSEGGKKVCLRENYKVYWALHLSHAKGHISLLYIQTS